MDFSSKTEYSFATYSQLSKATQFYIYLYVIKYAITMRTTIDLPEDLITKAMQVTGSKSKIETIKKALHEVIEREKRLKLLNFKGKIDLDIDLDSLRNRNSEL